MTTSWNGPGFIWSGSGASVSPMFERYFAYFRNPLSRMSALRARAMVSDQTLVACSPDTVLYRFDDTNSREPAATFVAALRQNARRVSIRPRMNPLEIYYTAERARWVKMSAGT